MVDFCMVNVSEPKIIPWILWGSHASYIPTSPTGRDQRPTKPGHLGGHFTGDGLRLGIDTCICWPLGASIFGGRALWGFGKLLPWEGRKEGEVFSDGRFFFVGKRRCVCFFKGGMGNGHFFLEFVHLVTL